MCKSDSGECKKITERHNLDCIISFLQKAKQSVEVFYKSGITSLIFFDRLLNIIDYFLLAHLLYKSSKGTMWR